MQTPNSSAVLRAAGFVVLLAGVFAVADAVGTPDREWVRAHVVAAGPWGPVVFVCGYAAWSLLPVPKNVATAAAGVLFGIAGGSALAWVGATLGALAAFGLARALGRDLTSRLLRGRLAAADTALGDRGFVAVLLARLVPVVPFTAVNYASGVTGVRFVPYLTATMLGMVPGTLAYAALGAYSGVDPTGTALAGTALIVLSLVGWGTARRLRHRPAAETPVVKRRD